MFDSMQGIELQVLQIKVLVDDGWLDTKSRLWTPKPKVCPNIVQTVFSVCQDFLQLQPKYEICPDSGLPSTDTVL